MFGKLATNFVFSSQIKPFFVQHFCQHFLQWFFLLNNVQLELLRNMIGARFIIHVSQKNMCFFHSKYFEAWLHILWVRKIGIQTFLLVIRLETMEFSVRGVSVC